MADRGLLGPDSVTWNMHADPAMWVAGITSLYLQALHPRAVAGVVQNSNFQQDPLGRLARTANFVGLSTYGPQDQVAEAAARVRTIHRSLRATDQCYYFWEYTAGKRYDFSPTNQLISNLKIKPTQIIIWASITDIDPHRPIRRWQA